VHVPTRDAEKITENGCPINQSQDIVFLRMEPAGGMKDSVERAIFEISSGQYEFQSDFYIEKKNYE
jgi:hypothetical protein